MIKINDKLCPMYMNENVCYSLIDENDERYIIPKRHSELDKLVMNKEGKYIIECSNGSNSISTIVDLMHQRFSNVSREILYKDVNNFIFSCWRLGLISWSDNINPYVDLYNKSINNYTCTILDENEVVKTFKDKTLYKFRYRPTVLSDIIYNNKNLRESCFFYIDQYCTIKKDDKIVAVFTLSAKKRTQFSANFHLDYLDSSYYKDNEILNELIEWAVKSYSRFINTKLNRIDALTLDNDLEYENVLSKLGFSFTGMLKKHIYDEENEQFSNLKMHSKYI